MTSAEKQLDEVEEYTTYLAKVIDESNVSEPVKQAVARLVSSLFDLGRMMREDGYRQGYKDGFKHARNLLEEE